MLTSDHLVSPLLRVVIALFVCCVAFPALAQDPNADQLTLIKRIKELLAENGQTRFVAPLPGSRSAVVSVDTSRELYFYLERGSIRGSSIDVFYEALASGDVQQAYDAFVSNAILILRVTDYGWNGLGVPIKTGSGRNSREIPDVLFKDVGGVFSRAAEITEEDVAVYVELLEVVLQQLQGEE